MYKGAQTHQAGRMVAEHESIQLTSHAVQPPFQYSPARFCCVSPEECHVQFEAAAAQLCSSGGSAGCLSAWSSAGPPERTTAPCQTHDSFITITAHLIKPDWHKLPESAFSSARVTEFEHVNDLFCSYKGCQTIQSNHSLDVKHSIINQDQSTFHNYIYIYI